MSRLMLIIAVVAAVGVCAALYFGRAKQPQQPTPSVPGAGVTATIPVEGMSCASCVGSVRKTVASIDGVTDVQVSLEHRQASVRYVPEKVSTEQITAAINKLGYRAGEPKVETPR